MYDILYRMPGTSTQDPINCYLFLVIVTSRIIQVLIESCRFPFAKLTCCGFQHESLHAIENDSKVVMPKLWLLANQVLQQQLHNDGCTYKLQCGTHIGNMLTHEAPIWLHCKC